MDIRTFRRIVTAFADEAIDVDISKGTMVAQIRDEIVEAKMIERDGTIWLREGDEERSAYRWILDRLARIRMLADRMIGQLPKEPYFVTPQGARLEEIDRSPQGSEDSVGDAADGIEHALTESFAGVTKVIYLTSDAGEGKTTLINQVARKLASKYKSGEASFILVPISLGGRPFMALDDIVVAELTNRYRFNLYYDAFIELVRLNAIVPALDGFEEVFLETDSGEAFSALGNLINHLDGSGRVLVAARKAYFEVRSFAKQARIFDTIGKDAGVSFERLSLRRWSRDKFCEYARLRGLPNPEEIHAQLAERLRDEEHPLLTRAVLVARLVDVALEGDVEALFDSLSQDPEDYFYQFVGALIEREAKIKWVDRSRLGDAASPLLTIDEHMSLLTQIAREMWINKTDSLRSDYIELVADVFSSEHAKSASVAHQIHERLHQHSLLVSQGTSTPKLMFDHEDFRLFFLGQALGNELVEADPRPMGAFLKTSPLPVRTVDAAVSFLVRVGATLPPIMNAVVSLGKGALDTSYEKENAGLIAIRLLEKLVDGEHRVDSLSFPAGSLEGRLLRNVVFVGCRFQATGIRPTDDWQVRFERCYFERIEMKSSEPLAGVSFEDCEISSILLVDRDEAYFGPDDIESILRQATKYGWEDELESNDAAKFAEIDDDAKIAEQALRAFMRATHINESVFRQRLGKNAVEFFDRILPVLLDEGVLQEVEYRGGGQQRRFKLTTPMRNIEPAIRNAVDFCTFIGLLKSGK